MTSSPAHQRTPTAAAAASLEVFLLGLVEYDAALALQERLVYEISGRIDAQGTLLLCEHPPVISIGREGSRAQVRADDHDLRACEIDVHWVARGGGAVIHAPGQLAVYPVLPLDRLRVGVDAFRRRLEETLVAACRDVRVPARRHAAAPGVWSRGGEVGHFGAAVKNWVSCHGAYLNVCTDPEFLRLVECGEERTPPPRRPGDASLCADVEEHADARTAGQAGSGTPAGHCGGRTATSLEAQRLRPVPMHKVRESVIHHLAAKFGYPRLHVYTGHPLLTRTTRRVCVTSSKSG